MCVSSRLGLQILVGVLGWMFNPFFLDIAGSSDPATENQKQKFNPPFIRMNAMGCVLWFHALAVDHTERFCEARQALRACRTYPLIL